MACCYHIPVWIVWITAAGNFTNNQHRTSVIFVANRGEENEWGDNSDLVTYITADTQSGSRAVGPITQFRPLSCSRFPHFVFQPLIKSIQTRPSRCYWLFLCFYSASRSVKVIFRFWYNYSESEVVKKHIFGWKHLLRSHQVWAWSRRSAWRSCSVSPMVRRDSPGLRSRTVRLDDLVFKLFLILVTWIYCYFFFWMNRHRGLGLGRWDFLVSPSNFSSSN